MRGIDKGRERRSHVSLSSRNQARTSQSTKRQAVVSKYSSLDHSFIRISSYSSRLTWDRNTTAGSRIHSPSALIHRWAQILRIPRGLRTGVPGKPAHCSVSRQVTGVSICMYIEWWACRVRTSLVSRAFYGAVGSVLQRALRVPC